MSNCATAPNYVGTTSGVAFAAKASYIGNHGNVPAIIVGDGLGLFFANSGISLADITDGTSNTFAAGERANKFGPAAWEAVHFTKSVNSSNGTVSTTNGDGRYVLGTTGTGTPGTGDPTENFSSQHDGGCHMLLCDGAVKFIGKNIGANIWSYLGNRMDGQAIGEF
jgi:prepilin-type processing-associated H-X9-DG protein